MPSATSMPSAAPVIVLLARGAGFATGGTIAARAGGRHLRLVTVGVATTCRVLDSSVVSDTDEDETKYSTRLRVTLAEQPGSEFVVRYAAGVLGDRLAVGQSLTVCRQTGGEDNVAYSPLTLRDSAGGVLVHQPGADALGRAGFFEMAAATGFELILRPSCREDVEEGCFVHRAQAEHLDIFAAEDRLVNDVANLETLTAAGVALHGSVLVVERGWPSPAVRRGVASGSGSRLLGELTWGRSRRLADDGSRCSRDGQST
jgi:hypothetical protein